MNAVFVFIGFPLVLSLILIFLRDKKMISASVSAGAIIIMLLLDQLLTLDEIIQIGSLNFRMGSSYTILGRTFSFSSEIQPLIKVFWLTALLWVGSGILKKRAGLLYPALMGISALLLASLTIDNFIYSALLIFISGLAAVIPLSSGAVDGRKLNRMVVFLTIALPVLLLMEWGLGNINPTSADETTFIMVLGLAGVGFGIWLAVVPFHSWIPLLGEDSPPLEYIFFTMVWLLTISIHLTQIMSKYSWVLDYPGFSETMTAVGASAVIFAGLSAAVQKHAGRFAGYLVLSEVGYVLLSAAQIRSSGIDAFRLLSAGRLASFILLAVFLLYLQQRSKLGLKFKDIAGAGKHPLAAAALLVSIFSCAGLPFTAGFAGRSIVWAQMAEQGGLVYLIVLLMGGFGIFVGGIRLAAVITAPSSQDEQDSIQIEPGMGGALIIGILLVVMPALIPWFQTWFAGQLPDFFQFLNNHLSLIFIML